MLYCLNTPYLYANKIHVINVMKYESNTRGEYFNFGEKCSFKHKSLWNAIYTCMFCPLWQWYWQVIGRLQRPGLGKERLRAAQKGFQLWSFCDLVLCSWEVDPAVLPVLRCFWKPPSPARKPVLRWGLGKERRPDASDCWWLEWSGWSVSRSLTCCGWQFEKMSVTVLKTHLN